jgi:adenylosuccinate lyase
MLLGAALGRDVAHKILEEATRRSAAEKRRLAEVLAEIPEVTRVLDSKTLCDLEKPEDYLGVAEDFRKRLVAGPGRQETKGRKD